jgi:hypothetical protein
MRTENLKSKYARFTKLIAPNESLVSSACNSNIGWGVPEGVSHKGASGGDLHASISNAINSMVNAGQN